MIANRYVRFFIRKAMEPYNQIGYNPRELRELMNLFSELKLNGTILEINMASVLTHFLWRRRFKHVISMGSRLHSRVRRLSRLFGCAGSGIIEGKPWDIPVMKKACKSIESLDVLFLHMYRYATLMPCYVIYSKLVRPGGVIVINNSWCMSGDHNFVDRFLEDLSSGYVDGYKHEFNNIKKGRFGISCEIKRAGDVGKVYNEKNKG